jgi:signal transduction histidine kinase
MAQGLAPGRATGPGVFEPGPPLAAMIGTAPASSMVEIRMLDTSLIQSRALLARQQLLQQQQHKRLARRIHDEISQNLTLLSLQLSLALMDPKPPANWPQTCKQWSDLVVELGQRLRDIVNELQPRILDELGLAAALQWYAHAGPDGIACQLLLPDEPVALPPSAANELLSICRDIIKEALVPNGVTEVTLQLEESGDFVRLHLRADEKGTSQETVLAEALDALSIHERLFCLDGAMETNSEPGRGLALVLCVPLSRQAVPHAA